MGLVFGQYFIRCVGKSRYGIVLLSLEELIVFESWCLQKYPKLQRHASQNIKLPCCLINFHSLFVNLLDFMLCV